MREGIDFIFIFLAVSRAILIDPPPGGLSSQVSENGIGRALFDQSSNFCCVDFRRVLMKRRCTLFVSRYSSSRSLYVSYSIGYATSKF